MTLPETSCELVSTANIVYKYAFFSDLSRDNNNKNLRISEYFQFQQVSFIFMWANIGASNAEYQVDFTKFNKHIAYK